MTVDGVSYPLERPFMVIATQNPIEYEGTYPLPEAQLDRFTMRLALGYPPLAEEARMLDEQTHEPPLDSLEPVAAAGDVLRLAEQAREVYVEESLGRYVVARPAADARRRAALPRRQPARPASRSSASRRRARSPTGATTSCPTTSRRSPCPCSSHRLILGPEARSAGLGGAAIVREAIEKTPVPV